MLDPALCGWGGAEDSFSCVSPLVSVCGEVCCVRRAADGWVDCCRLSVLVGRQVGLKVQACLNPSRKEKDADG